MQDLSGWLADYHARQVDVSRALPVGQGAGVAGRVEDARMTICHRLAYAFMEAADAVGVRP